MYIPNIYQVDYNNPHVVCLTQKYVNNYYTKVPYTDRILGEYFEEIIQQLLRPNEFMLYSVEPKNILDLIDNYNLSRELKIGLMELIKLYILCIPLNTVLISSLIYKNGLLNFLIIDDPYFSSQLLDYNIYNSFTEAINLEIEYNFYTSVAFNELAETFFNSYLNLLEYANLAIPPIYKYQFARFNDYLSDIIIDQQKTKTKAYKYLQFVDDLFLTDMYYHNLSNGVLLFPEDYDAYIKLISGGNNNSTGIEYYVNDFFHILTNKYVSRDSYEIIRLIRSKIREVLFDSYMFEAPIEYKNDYVIRSVLDTYNKITKEVYADIASYLLNGAEITQLSILDYIQKENIITYLSNLVLYEYLGFLNWVISKSIGYYKNDKFIHRLSTFMQHCLINKEVLMNANYT